MSSPPRISPFDLSLETLRSDHPEEYRLWVLVGVATSLLGYAASTFALVGELGWSQGDRIKTRVISID